jgi:feruloyl esterase
MAYAENPPPSYSYRDFNFDTEITRLEEYAAVYDPVAPHTDPDLSKFRKLGGKLIVNHGWADASVSPLTSVDFYSEVTQKQGGMDKVKDWYRLFMLPGMFHCRGGDVPDNVDWLTAIVGWVENNQPPDRLVSAQYKDHDRRTGKHGGLLRTRS